MNDFEMMAVIFVVAAGTLVTRFAPFAFLCPKVNCRRSLRISATFCLQP